MGCCQGGLLKSNHCGGASKVERNSRRRRYASASQNKLHVSRERCRRLSVALAFFDFFFCLSSLRLQERARRRLLTNKHKQRAISSGYSPARGAPPPPSARRIVPSMSFFLFLTNIPRGKVRCFFLGPCVSYSILRFAFRPDSTQTQGHAPRRPPLSPPPHLFLAQVGLQVRLRGLFHLFSVLGLAPQKTRGQGDTCLRAGAGPLPR